MQKMTLEIEIKGQVFVLHNSGALYWKKQEILLISDAHLGKITHFRKHGLALPTKAISKNFSNLDQLVAFFAPKSICFLGDLFHSSMNNEWLLFADWVNRTALSMVLVVGNHDIVDRKKYEELHIPVVGEWQLDGFLLTHFPEEREGFYTFSGHIHPSILLVGKGRQFLKLPCFFQSSSQMILPAFGEFTGTYVIELQQGDRAYVLTDDEVIQIQSTL